ncbi:MAG: response regulator [Nostoc sp.]
MFHSTQNRYNHLSFFFLRLPKVKKILVIENEAQSREMLLEFLEVEGFEVIGAENGLLGIQRLQESPDIVICDIVMPELDGYGVLSYLRQNPNTARIAFIFLTATMTSQAERRYGLELGADEYLLKPCTAEDLLKAIAKVSRD